MKKNVVAVLLSSLMLASPLLAATYDDLISGAKVVTPPNCAS
jgi:hypothetical protein